VSLVEPFLASMETAERSRWEVVPDLAVHLERIVATAQRDCPTVEVPSDEFARYLGERVARGDTSWLPQLPAEDLYLACGCGRGDAAAIAAVEARYFPAIEAIVRGRLGDPSLASEAMQRMRAHLFVGERPHILDYAGRGALDKWLAVTAVRAGLRVIRETRRETALADDALADLVDTSGDVALAHLRQRYRDDFKQAFADAFAALPARDRNLLRHSVLDGLGVEAIAELHNVHKSTASRWLTQIRETLMTTTRASLRTRLKISAAEVESILTVLADQADVTLENILRATRR
jgi:RNA polymerase sigma-70 factor, ECF subfamily